MVVYRPSCVLSDGGNEVSIGRTTTTPDFRSVCSFRRSLCQSTTARRKLPSPNCMIRSGYCAPGKSRRFSVLTMGSLLISHTTCLDWYDRLANFNTPDPCFERRLMINEQFYEKSVARIMV